MGAYHYIKRYKSVIVIQTDEISIPASDEDFIRSVPADIWQAAQRGDNDALGKVWDLAIAAGYEDEYVDREYADDVEDTNPEYYYDEWSN
jgi:hypothetical protein